MKIYFVDKENHFNKLIQRIKQEVAETVERKEDLKFRSTKNDYIIVCDESLLDGLEKQKNIIFLVKNKEYKHIWKLSNNYKTVDLIDTEMCEDYIVKRIKRLVVKEV